MFLAFSAALGLIFGSHLNVIIHRGPYEWGLVDGISPQGARSRCPACDRQLTLADLVPLVSYAVLKGKCRSCKADIPLRYPVVEAITAAAFVAFAYVFGPTVEFALADIFVAVMIAIAVIDIETQFVPDMLVLPLLLGGIAVNTVDLFVPWPQSLLGASVGYLAFEAIRRLYVLLRGREGLGGGDPKLLAAIGAWSGASALPGIVFAGSVLTLGVVLGQRLIDLRRSGHTDDQAFMEQPVAFGPGLAMGGVIAFVANAALPVPF